MTRLVVGGAEVLLTGSGSPVTVMGHGLAGSIGETRPFGSGVRGTRAFLHFRGHGATPSPVGEPWSYEGLAAQLRAVADHVGASRALGVSMGAGALLALLARTPDRFGRVVLVLPGALDGPRGAGARDRFAAMAGHVEAGDVTGLAVLLRDELPAVVRGRPDAGVWTRRQAERLVGTPVGEALRAVPDLYPVADRTVLASVHVPVLVVAQEGDRTHPASVARELGAVLPRVSVRVLPAGGVLWSHRREVRALVSGFLNAPA
ncbi:MAG TPA: alpha/beta hydrolase [Jiangellales bacterium]|nr:alpha/beta hydrolase [Jiangellales bacterium]